MFLTYADGNRSFESIGIWFPFAATVTGTSEPEQVRTVGVSQGVLEALGVQPRLGRSFGERDYQPGGPETVMITYGYWQRRFGGDSSIVGRTLSIDRPREIIGVMPDGFRVVTADPEIIVPMRQDRSQTYLVPFNFQTVARLKPGVSLAQANADLARLIRVWMGAWSMPPGLGGSGNPFEPWRITPTARPLKQDVVGNVGNVLWVVTGTIGIVLLIACANVANLLLVRAEGRQHELAVRSALGAGWWRIVRELLLESMWLALLGGVLGIVLAYAGVGLLVNTANTALPRLHEISIDLPVLGFALGVSLLSGLLFGLIPAFRYAGARALTASRTASHDRRSHRTRDGLAMVQVALALVMLVGSGLMIRTFQAMRAVDPGFARPEQLQTVRISFPVSVVATPGNVAQLQKEIQDRVAAIPGVTSVAFTSAMPMEGILPNPILSSRSPFLAEREVGNVALSRPLRIFKAVSPGFFRTSGTRLVTGRDYTWLDLERRMPVVMVSENLANELWGSPAAALGQRVRATPGGPWREVIGVVQNVHENGVHAVAPAIVYWPSAMESVFSAGEPEVPRSVAFVVRSSLAGTEGLVEAIRKTVWSVNSNLPVALVRTMEDVYDASMARTSFTLVMLAMAGAIALVLGIVGIYGVISYAVAQRTQEIGIRLALGAQQGELRRMFLRYGLVLASVGVAIGLGGAVALTRLMRSLLFEVSALDPITYAAVPCVLFAAALLASYVPARRAAAVDPIGALKAE
jgi:predicted permease